MVGAFSWFLCSPLFPMWNDILDTTSLEAVTASASHAVIKTASKHLHNDLARAIEALEQKKSVLDTQVALSHHFSLRRVMMLPFH